MKPLLIQAELGEESLGFVHQHVWFCPSTLVEIPVKPSHLNINLKAASAQQRINNLFCDMQIWREDAYVETKRRQTMIRPPINCFLNLKTFGLQTE